MINAGGDEGDVVSTSDEALVDAPALSSGRGGP